MGKTIKAATVACALGVGCGPVGSSGQCDESLPCEGRGEECDLLNNVCVPIDVDTSSTESPAPATFSQKPIAFHRGQVCLQHQVQAGQAFPVMLNPCLHPCIDTTNNLVYKFKHNWKCVGSSCEAWVVMWVTADSATNCPENAFSEFDPAQCVYLPEPVETFIDPTLGDGTSVQGTMLMEIPFLTNADIAAIAASNADANLIQSKIDQYPRDDSRVPGGMAITLAAGNPPPPETCTAGGCDCFQVGF